ncbi:hypothetical protein ACFQ6N_04010 [Kitasatospora sp. NPDC056446]|uniref:hypothetical protein n=1 Tax=Kitasatospora sp. NPDC056446 TaxID=3345819 RepID=UPI00369EF8A9
MPVLGPVPVVLCAAFVGTAGDALFAPVIGVKLMTVGNGVLWLTMAAGCAATAPAVGRVLRPLSPAPERAAACAGS